MCDEILLESDDDESSDYTCFLLLAQQLQTNVDAMEGGDGGTPQKSKRRGSGRGKAAGSVSSPKKRQKKS